MVGRIYDVSVSCEKAVSTIAMCSSSSVDVETKLLSPSRHAIALGDTAVSFDFGEPIDMGQDVQTSRSRYLWPGYVLLGNGEVYRVITSVDVHTLVYRLYFTAIALVFSRLIDYKMMCSFGQNILCSSKNTFYL